MALQHASFSSFDPYAEASFGFFKKEKDHSGTGFHSGHGFEYLDGECCPLVVDLLCLGVILFSIAGATLLLARVTEIELMARRRRSAPYASCVHEGKLSSNIPNGFDFPACRHATNFVSLTVRHDYGKISCPRIDDRNHARS